jgi:hypothetical protein
MKSHVGAVLDRALLENAALRQAAQLRSLLSGVSGRPLIAADRELSLLIPAVKTSSVMSPLFGNANPADPDLTRRARECAELLAAETPAERRRAIIARNGIDLIVLRKDTPDGLRFAGDSFELLRDGPTMRLYAARPDAGTGYSARSMR